jgi:hypothetical protein
MFHSKTSLLPTVLSTSVLSLPHCSYKRDLHELRSLFYAKHQLITRQTQWNHWWVEKKKQREAQWEGESVGREGIKSQGGETMGVHIRMRRKAPCCPSSGLCLHAWPLSSIAFIPAMNFTCPSFQSLETEPKTHTHTYRPQKNLLG